MRSVLWNYFKVDSVIESCDTVREGRKSATIRGSQEAACQLTFWDLPA